jgi:hypothetical protein
MNDSNEARELLRGMFAPFDAKAWERFREWDAEGATYLYDAVRAGMTADEIRDYGQANGYSPAAVSWLGHAAAWLRRSMDAPDTVTEPPTVKQSRKRIEDGETATAGAAVVYRIHDAGTLRPPGRTNE